MELRDTLKKDLVEFIDGKLSHEKLCEKHRLYKDTIDSLSNNDALDKASRTYARLMQLAVNSEVLRKDKAFINAVQK